MGWAALMAAAIALYALGVSLESRPQAPSAALMVSAICLGGLASLIFGGDLCWLARREVQRRRALRTPRTEYGELDYQPEFMSAMTRYLEAQQQITDATSRTGEVFTRHSKLSSQGQADECGKAAQELCDVYARLLPVMSEDGTIARRCLKGFLKVSRPTTTEDMAALRGLRDSTRGARRSTQGFLRAIREGRKITLGLRKKNIARSLNESTTNLQRHLKDAAEVVHGTAKWLRAAERHMSRRLMWYSARNRLSYPHRSEQSVAEPRSTVDE